VVGANLFVKAVNKQAGLGDIKMHLPVTDNHCPVQVYHT
jgi:hypothetical protein